MQLKHAIATFDGIQIQNSHGNRCQKTEVILKDQVTEGKCPWSIF